MKHLLLTLLLLLPLTGLMAITQPGYVRTIARPNAPSKRLNGVMLRVRGGHNAVVSTDKGDFAILMQEIRNGDPYALSAVMKSGYQLVEQEFIGRNQAGSDKVPLVISMVNTAQLQADKAAIADKASAEIEKRYMAELQQLEKQLKANKVDQREYERRITALDNKLMHMQEQLEEMADKYARTDYDQLDAEAAKINAAIEQGDMDKAERLILSKGSLSQREDDVHELQREAAARLQDLHRDYYHLYSIALTRFQPDSAAHFLRLRAELDTTNAAAQLDYAKFLNEYQRDREEAYRYVCRAERLVRHGDGERSMLMLRVLNEQGTCYSRMPNSASRCLTTTQQAVELSAELYGTDHHYTATRRVTLGASYYSAGRLDEAKAQLQEALRVFALPEQTDSISQSNALNNLGGIAFAEKDYAAARSHFEQAHAILIRVAPDDPNLPVYERNLGYICHLLGDQESSARYYRQALASARRILGANHQLTRDLQSQVDKL